ncbi:alpha/beta hydrolase [Brevundimonas naejangsanensis]|uniref:Alpha/beta hydrolase n=1 Tax=Brevundimonas naejangsanensis TaxID=588932 RepID=A0A494RNT1_9CAUL|nr:alpha/beta hydrolase-fold protein [Brevundimonas naejangsanensis]AYG95086.1 alpha/beta hydrolase [Brevundimonas naejangsanensis]
MSLSRRMTLGLLAALPFAGKAMADIPVDGTLVEHPDFASSHVRPRNVTVWLPPGYEAGSGRHPVLYMHDGQNLFDAAKAPFGEWGVDEHLGRLIANDQVRAPIVVGVWNTPLRLREYVPADLIAALPADVRDDVQAIYGGAPLSDGYLRFLVEELKPFIDQSYRTLTGPSDTMVSGSSMGGLISLYAVMKHPQVFGAAACLSTHWPLRIDGLDDPAALAVWRDKVVGAWTGVVANGLPAPGSHRFYFDRGDETLDQFYATFQSRIDAVFREKGYGPRDFQTLVFPGHRHNEASWNGRLDVPLKFLLTPA